jgi:hypothetical protein
MERNLSFRYGKETDIFDLYTPLEYLEYEYELKNVPIPGLPLLDPGIFPKNIEKLFWTHKDNMDVSAIGMTTDKIFFFFEAKYDYDYYTDLEETGEYKIYLAKKYENIIKYALDDYTYKLYIEETLNFERKPKKDLKGCYFTTKFGEELKLDNKKFYFSSDILSQKNIKIIKRYSNEFNLFHYYGLEYIRYYINKHKYVYEISFNNEKIHKVDNIENIDLKNENEYDVYEDKDEGIIKNIRKGFKAKLRYIYDSLDKNGRYYSFKFIDLTPEIEF